MEKEQKTKKSEEDLKSVAGEVVYEINMLITCAVELSKLNATKNAYLESFLIHFRNLRDFFYPDKAFPDDILAEHYLPTWKDKPEMNEFWQKSREKLNKLVAHLSFKRAELAKDKNWPVNDDMCKDVMKVWDGFVRNLPQDKRKWFEQTE